MTNVNIQGNVKVDGRGHTNKINRGYVPGEYRKLVNAEIDSTGRLINRRPINSVADVMVDNPYGFIGHWGPWAMLNAIDGMRIYNGSNSISYALWSPNDNLTTDGNPNSWHVVKKFVRYNGINHWITSEYRASTGTYRINILHSSDPLVNPLDASSLASVQNFGTTTLATVVSKLETAGSLDIREAFVHKDRLWVVCSDSVYFSKPTDFLEFDPPDGGFFLYPECYLQGGIANKDSIYLVGSSGVYFITYATDPNVDSVVRTINGSGGGDSCCIYEDNVYLTKDDFLYVVMNGNISKVMDLNLGFYGHSNVYTKLESFGEYIVMLRYKNKSYASNVTDEDNEFTKPTRVRATGQPVGDIITEDSDKQYCLYFLNMTTGSIHVVDFADRLEDEDWAYRGYVSDVYFLPVEDGFNNYHLYLLTKHPQENPVIGITGYSGDAHRGAVYQMPLSVPTDPSYSIIDTWLNESGVPFFAWAYVDVEIEGYVPDGNELMMKKFRSLLFQGKPPLSTLKLYLGFDGADYTLDYSFAQSVLDPASPNQVMPSRYPINQRARSLHINLRTVEFDPLTLTGDGSLQRFSIEDIKVLWGYTQRAPINRNQNRYLS